ncbi:uncharacterized protein MYCGRDRAFT_103183 [Zymoseptoria tritici IPO323]|uniref:Uncharacterized protein n=1 Tax=Zymoseptoria tritici (strain CBS 115943 / IPO323) TaxID=336722 RepID=F9X496_ZYMTI|nr:uncharacterized protein MYCGRDRAFT_103183 [Zymoseptoria tritici IPO323]EGP89858.1 hypothetical protein MYCGRDRAFT_103183 [Zymoseptoria tritici IPO323]
MDELNQHPVLSRGSFKLCPFKLSPIDLTCSLDTTHLRCYRWTECLFGPRPDSASQWCAGTA